MLIMTACDDFLDVKPKGLSIPDTVEEYDEMLNTASMNIEHMLYYLPDASMTSKAEQAATLSMRNAYTWNTDYSGKDPNRVYNSLYADVNMANIIIENVDDALSISSNENLRRTVKGQAYATRALSYFYLVNLFSKQYNQTSAKDDMSVPMVTKFNINQTVQYSNVQTVYDTIVADLKIAESLIDVDDNVYKLRPNSVAVNALFAKVYLQMGNYTAALPYAQKAYEGYNFLYDYNETEFITEPVRRIISFSRWFNLNDEMIWYRTAYANNIGVTTDFADNVMDKTVDQRFRLFVVDNNFGTPFEPYGMAWDKPQNSGLSTGELYLIYAECLIRANRKEDCLQILNEFRSNRYTPDSYEISSSLTEEEILDAILKERRIELFMTMNYWFDLKRLHNEGMELPTFTRTFEGHTYTLEPGSDKFVLDIPLSVRVRISQ